MATIRIWPVHILYQHNIEKEVRAAINNLSNNLPTKSSEIFSAIRIGAFCMGEGLRTLQVPNAVTNNIGVKENFHADFAGGLKWVLESYKTYSSSSHELLSPILGCFFSNYPTDKNTWASEWQEIIEQFQTTVFVQLLASKHVPRPEKHFPVTPKQQLPIIKASVINTEKDLKRIIDQHMENIQYGLNLKKNNITIIEVSGIDKTLSHSQVADMANFQKVSLPPSSSPESMKPTKTATTPAANAHPDSGSSYSSINTAADRNLASSGASKSADQTPTPLSGSMPPELPKAEPSKPIALKPAQPAEWQVREPPAELGDRKPHAITDSRQAGENWYISGASRRGKLHENEATFREDAFAIEYAAGWILVAVADGAGSHHLSRVGSNLAVKTVIAEMEKGVKKDPPSEAVALVILQTAMRQAWIALSKEAQTRKIDVRDLSTTLLLLMYHPRSNLVGIAQVGDGLIAGQFEDGNIFLLGKPESGEYSGQTYFLTNHKPEELPDKCEALQAPQPIRYFFVMTDGVADDLYPPKEKLPGLIKAMPSVMAAEFPDREILELINYNRPGSFDDRTLVVVCKRAEIAAQASPKVEKQPASTDEQPKVVDSSPGIQPPQVESPATPATGAEPKREENVGNPVAAAQVDSSPEPAATQAEDAHTAAQSPQPAHPKTEMEPDPQSSQPTENNTDPNQAKPSDGE